MYWSKRKYLKKYGLTFSDLYVFDSDFTKFLRWPGHQRVVGVQFRHLQSELLSFCIVLDIVLVDQRVKLSQVFSLGLQKLRSLNPPWRHSLLVDRGGTPYLTSTKKFMGKERFRYWVLLTASLGPGLEKFLPLSLLDKLERTFYSPILWYPSKTPPRFYVIKNLTIPLFFCKDLTTVQRLRPGKVVFVERISWTETLHQE